jgi:hypothetical protein
MLSAINLEASVMSGRKAWIKGKPRGDQNLTAIAFGELTILFGLVGLSAPAGSHY